MAQSIIEKCSEPFLLIVLVRTLIKSMYELNVNALCTVTLLALGIHHKFKEIRLCFFVIRPDLRLPLQTVVTLLVLGIANSGIFNITAPPKMYCSYIILHTIFRVQHIGITVIIIVQGAAISQNSSVQCAVLFKPESVKLSKQQSGAPAPKRYSPRHCFC